jgi:hypothetical protein
MKRITVLFAGLLLLHAGLEAQSLPKVKAPKISAPKVGNPAKAAERSVGAALEGDTKTLTRIVDHTVAHAIERYNLKGLVAKSDIDRAHTEMYDFLKWKLGSPSAVAAQYATAGYEHFDRAYSDEAGAALLGFELPREKGGHAEFIIPPALIQLRLMVQKATIPLAAKVLQDTYGIPAFISSMVLNACAESEARMLKRIGINLPHDYDFPDGLIKLTMDARRDPEGTRSRLQKLIDQKVAAK